MTERLYFADSYQVSFEARVLERLHLPPDGRLAVILDRTAFAPAIAGIASDRGALNEVQVSDVIEEGGRLLHVIAQDTWQDEVEGRVDWPRRFGLMQHHTAQHILSEGLAQVAGAETMAVSVTPQTAWVEVYKLVSEADLERAESWANQVIAAGRQVRVAAVDAAQAAGLRGLGPGQPLVNGQPGRVFNIEGLRSSICYANHVARTSEIGLLRIGRVSRSGDRLRVEFQCGTRILEEYRRLSQIVARQAALLGVQPAEVPQAVAALKTQSTQAMEGLTALHDKMLEYEGVALKATQAEQVGKWQLVSQVFPDGRDAAETRDLVRAMVKQPGLIVMMGTAGARAQLFFACSSDVDLDMNTPLKTAAQVLGTQGGGQAKRWAESLVVQADAARVEAALAKARALLKARR
ncbi:MAG: hypothetical protein JW850_20585 [Thermoflexales bacterium]|nr:hypothetical protein [Thermoflexales bacterium]